MSSHGKLETEKLKKYLEEQLRRLLLQLEDLTENRNTLDEDSHEELMQLTKEDLEEFNASLQRMISGDTTLIDDVGAVQLATQAVIDDTSKTPDVVRMFAKREVTELRKRLVEIDSYMKLGKLSKDCSDHQRGEVLNALKQLGEKLEPEELQLLEKLKLGNIDAASYVQVAESTEKGEMAMAVVGDEVRTSQNT